MSILIFKACKWEKTTLITVSLDCSMRSQRKMFKVNKNVSSFFIKMEMTEECNKQTSKVINKYYVCWCNQITCTQTILLYLSSE